MDYNIKSKESIVKLKNLAIEKIFFKRNIEKNISNNLKVSFSVEYSELKEDEQVKLTARISAEDRDALELEITICGLFTIQEDDEALKRELAEKNTLSIMFPYLRSQITLVTTQPDFKPIVLPAININALVEEEKEN